MFCMPSIKLYYKLCVCCHIFLCSTLSVFLTMTDILTKTWSEEINLIYNKLQGTFTSISLEKLVNMSEFIAKFICALLLCLTDKYFTNPLFITNPLSSYKIYLMLLIVLPHFITSINTPYYELQHAWYYYNNHMTVVKF